MGAIPLAKSWTLSKVEDAHTLKASSTMNIHPGDTFAYVHQQIFYMNILKSHFEHGIFF